tara:strand:+ start:2494 stop:4929 length:2436 start_codon:yes stop_codon:yes gene_type:complete
MSLGNTNIHQSGEIPEITKLPNGRIRIVRRFVKFTREDVDNVNLGSLMGDFGDLDTTGEQVENQGYANCRLIEVEVETSTKRASGTDSSNSVLVQTYETLTSSFVQTTDPTISYTESGLKQITNVSRAVSGTVSSGVIGVTQLITGEFLASSKIEDNTAFAELTEVYLEAGTLSETLDNVGSQKAKVIEAIGIDPVTPSGYLLASKQESDFEGFQTNRFTFLKPSVLSKSEDKVGSQLAITIEAFSEVPATPSGYKAANVQASDFEGIKTNRYTFLKPNILSEVEDKVGSQKSITIEAFDQVPVTPANYQLANEQVSDVKGIPTRRYTFLKPSVLSNSKDNVGSQKAITIEAFGEVPVTPSGYQLADERVSEVEGIPTKRFTFLKPSILNESQDNVGSQKSITIEAFDQVPVTPAGYQLANKSISNFQGIKTNRYVFLKSSILSKSEDKVGSQKSITIEAFGETPATPAGGYVLASNTASDFEGIKTNRFTFLKPSVLSRVIQRNNNGRLIIETVEAFNQVPTAETSGAVQIGTEESNVDGIKTKRFTFAKGDGQISVDKSPAPSQISGCTQVTVTSIGTAVTPTGVLISESETQSDGFITYVKTSIQGTITGIKQTYKDVAEVTTAGTVNCTQVQKSVGNISGTIAVTEVKPPRNQSLKATVTVEILASPPNTVALAYDLGDISCSVTSISMSENFRGTDVFTTESGNSRFSGQRKSADMSARISTYPNCYLTSSSGSGTFSYTSSYENTSTSPNSIVSVAQNSRTNTFTDGTGSTSATYSTTGVIRRDSRPILTALDGTTYFEVITWTV